MRLLRVMPQFLGRHVTGRASRKVEDQDLEFVSKKPLS